jgi:hypothetical protein
VDLFVGNKDLQANRLYENINAKYFIDITENSGFNDTIDTRGTTFIDFDNDGDLDLYTANAFGNNIYYENNGNDNNWIKIKPVGTVSNKSAIGARVKIKANIWGTYSWQMREITSQSGSRSQSGFTAHFGLGNAEIIDSVLVEFPSGIDMIYAGIPVNQTIISQEENFAPVANNDNITSAEDSTIIIDAGTLLQNDTDANGDSIIISGVDSMSALGGNIHFENNKITYTPILNYNGNDTFNYTVTDGFYGGVDNAVVIINVSPVNDAPVAVDDNLSVEEDIPYTFPFNMLLINDTDVDGDDLFIHSLDTTDSDGSAKIDSGDTTITYTPKANFFGEDIFRYTISDNNGGLDTASVNISVNPVEDRPLAVDDTVTTQEDNTIIIHVLQNDVDVDGDSLLIQFIDTTDTKGEVTISQDYSTLTYSPPPNFFGFDTLSYTITDGHIGGTDTAVVLITISVINDLPLAKDDSFTTSEDTPLSILITDLLANDSDVETNPPLFESIISTNTLGFVNIEAGDTSIRYSPRADYNGGDSFSYTIVDDDGGRDTASVEITITPVQDAPMTFELSDPLNGEVVDSTTVTFRWQKSIDPDNEEVTYNFYLSGITGDTAVYGLSDTVLVFNGNTYLHAGNSYTWEVTVTDGTDTTSCISTHEFSTATVLVGIDEEDNIPDVFSLGQNFPNPFNPGTTISYTLPAIKDGHANAMHEVSLIIYDVLGREVAVLENRIQSPGRYTIRFDASDLNSGIYIYSLKAGKFHESRKMILLK